MSEIHDTTEFYRQVAADSPPLRLKMQVIQNCKHWLCRVTPGALRLRLAMTACCIVSLMRAGEALSQETIYIGGRQTGPAVEVDLSAIPGLLAPGLSSTQAGGPRAILPPGAGNRQKARTPPAPEKPAPAPMGAVSAAPAPALVTPPAPSPAAKPAAAPTAALAPAAKPAPIAPQAAMPQRAALPAPAAPAEAGATVMLFAPGAVELTPEAAAQLDAIAASLPGQARLQLKAHASGADNDAETRRTALKRALAARSHLLARGVDSTRIDVRALGPASDGGPPDRVELIMLTQ